MKVFYALVPVIVVCLVCLGLAGGVSADTGAPSVDEIFMDGIDYPPYTVGTFLDDMTLLITDSDFSTFDFSDFASFIVEDTFIGDISSGSMGVETITDSWVNIFFTVSIAICLVCIVSAVLAEREYRKMS
ncbi:MAG: hypothetical protein WC067_05590 [Candidatus Methanomethylophilaceae archaeon]